MIYTTLTNLKWLTSRSSWNFIAVYSIVVFFQNLLNYRWWFLVNIFVFNNDVPSGVSGWLIAALIITLQESSRRSSRQRWTVTLFTDRLGRFWSRCTRVSKLPSSGFALPRWRNTRISFQVKTRMWVVSCWLAMHVWNDLNTLLCALSHENSGPPDQVIFSNEESPLDSYRNETWPTWRGPFERSWGK